ncbi:MAG: HAD-IIIC family phosphatase [Terracidiphilus sp.]
MGVPFQIESLKKYLNLASPEFEGTLKEATREALDFSTVLQLCTIRKRALQKDLLAIPSRKRRVAMVGGANLRPLVTFIEHFSAVLGGVSCEFWIGEYDNYNSEILDVESPLYKFKPDTVLLLPSERRCSYNGALDSTRAEQEDAGRRAASEVLNLCNTIHVRSEAEVIVGNFRLSPYFDPGPMRNTSLVSEYSFRKFVNMEIGARLPAYVHLCDIEFLSNRRGNLSGVDERTWFESKQPFSANLLVDVAREYAFILTHLACAAKKVLILDLDNTLWGGVIGDDGLEGIELGTTSPRGEAYRDLQMYLLELSKRGVLLAVCSKNDYDRAIEPFEKHPEMVLRLKDIVCFKANWEPKSDNILQIARELNLGLDSLVFLDDNRAEIEIVNQFAPEVTTIWAGDDPSEFVAKLKDSRLFELRKVTAEDVQRVQQYKLESERQQLLSASTDMGAYLDSLEMTGIIKPFDRLDAPRIAQLIAKSNQFNLTTRRRTEAEVLGIAEDEYFRSFTMRLSDRFGDHGLIAVVIGNVHEKEFVIDTWLMSCRVLKRQVEEEVLNEIVHLAQHSGCTRVIGQYIPSAKNGMVRELYPRMGFVHVREEENGTQIYALDIAQYEAIATKIKMTKEIYATAGSHS